MPINLTYGEMIKQIIYAAIIVLFCTSTSAFHGTSQTFRISKSFARIALNSKTLSPSLQNCKFEERAPSQSFPPLCSSPIIDTSIDDSFGNSTNINNVFKADPAANPKMSVLAQLKSLLSGNGLGNGKFSVNKENISKLGLNVLLAYGFVSNVSYITCLILAWVTHGKSTGLSPLVPGQWKKFLLVYATFFAANNILRPLRFTLSVAITPVFNKFIDIIEEKSGWTRRTSTGVTIFLVNICGTFMYLFGGLFIATTIAKVPLLR